MGCIAALWGIFVVALSMALRIALFVPPLVAAVAIALHAFEAWREGNRGTAIVLLLIGLLVFAVGVLMFMLFV